MTDLYQILNVTTRATQDEIKTAYRWAAIQNHPDKCGDNGHSKMVEINAAYEILSNPERRGDYDQFGNDMFNPKFHARQETQKTTRMMNISFFVGLGNLGISIVVANKIAMLILKQLGRKVPFVNVIAIVGWLIVQSASVKVLARGETWIVEKIQEYYQTH